MVGRAVLVKLSSENLISLTHSNATTPQPPTTQLHPGSGYLCVKVLNDGPTRCLQISDIMQVGGGGLVGWWMSG